MGKNLYLNDLSIGYSGKALVSDINITLESGMVYAILGLNGTGKTTLLRTLLGFLPAIKGDCVFDGESLFKLSDKERAQLISYVPQRYSKGLGTNVVDMVLMGYNPQLKLLEYPSENQRQFAINIMNQMDLTHLADRDFSTLSAGQQQMVILSRALVQNTFILAMDEPDSGLDFPHKHKTLTYMKDLAKSQGKLVLTTLHDPNFAFEYCDGILTIVNNHFSMLDLNSSSKTEIQNSLKKLYDNIALIEYKNRYYMIKDDSSIIE